MFSNETIGKQNIVMFDRDRDGIFIHRDCLAERPCTIYLTMRLNTFEKALMNNPIRAALQRYFEARILKKLGGKMRGGLALEIGCGRGMGTCIIFEEFRAEHVHAFDIDPHMVQLARHSSCRRPHKQFLWVGDTLNIAVPSNTYDAVFDFGAIHHVVQWRDTIREVYRVLKPGGRFYVEEILEKYIVPPNFLTAKITISN